MTIPARPHSFVGPSLVLAAVLCASSAQAARVESSLNLAPSLIYTDNVCLSENNKKDDWVGVVTPSGNIGVKGKRAFFNVNGYVSLNSLTNSQLENRGCGGGRIDDRDQYTPRIRANGSVNVIRNYLKVNVSGRADRNAINSRLAGGDDALDRTGNTNNYYRYNITPIFTTRLGSAANLNLRYAFDELKNEKNKANDSIRQSVSLAINSRGSSQVSLGISARHSEVEYTNDDPDLLQRSKTDRQSARMTFGYRFDRRLAINGNAGYDFNNLKTNNQYDRNDYAWQLNFRWTPNRRTSVLVGTGDRFYGTTPKLDVRYAHQRSTFTLGYDKKITYDRDIRTQGGGTLEEFGVVQSLQSRNPIIDERVTLGYNYSGHNMNVSLHGHHSEQTRTIDNAKGTFYNIGLTVTPYISASYSISYLLNYSQDEPRSRIGEESRDFSESWTAGITYAKPINNTFNFSLSYLFTDRSADRDTGEYQENRVVGTLSINL